MEIREPAEATAWSRRQRKLGRRIGLVPTMGALHAGHESLIETATRACDDVVVSIFVNPTQFGPQEDFEKYPRPLEKDLEVCAAHGVGTVFVPSIEDMYPSAAKASVSVGPPLTTTFEGERRPGHFDGVSTIVTKLLNIVEPDIAYFGKKDAQQCAVVKALVHDLLFPVEISICPLVRDDDGLALSSRNAYLSAEERNRALAIPRSLAVVRHLFRDGERAVANLVKSALDILAEESLRPDYCAIVDPATFEMHPEAREGDDVIIAVPVGPTRLLDVVTLETATPEIEKAEQ